MPAIAENVSLDFVVSVNGVIKKIKAPSRTEAWNWAAKCAKTANPKISVYTSEEYAEEVAKVSDKPAKKDDADRIVQCVGCNRRVSQRELDYNGGLCRVCGTSGQTAERELHPEDEPEPEARCKKCKAPMREREYIRFRGKCKNCNKK